MLRPKSFLVASRTSSAGTACVRSVDIDPPRQATLTQSFFHVPRWTENEPAAIRATERGRDRHRSLGLRPNELDVEVFREAGVKMAFRIGNRVNPLPLRDRYEINRLGVRGDESMAAFRRKIKWGRWF